MMRFSQITVFAAVAWVVGWAITLMLVGIFGAFKWLVRAILPMVIMVTLAGCMSPVHIERNAPLIDLEVNDSANNNEVPLIP